MNELRLRYEAERPKGMRGAKFDSFILQKEELKRREEVAKLAKSLTRISEMGLEIVLRRMPDPKPLNETEREMWSESFAPLVAKYLPSAIKYQEEIGFGICLIAIFGDRMIKPKESKPVSVPAIP